MAEITQLLAHFSYDQIQHLALTLGLSLSEITTREAYCSGPEELLCVLLMEWKRRSVVNLKRKLARALLDCQEFEAAIKVDPTCAGEEKWYIVKAWLYLKSREFEVAYT